MQHAVRESAPRDFGFLPGLLLVVEFVAPEHLSPRWSIVSGSRDEGIHDMYASRWEGCISSPLCYRPSISIDCHRPSTSGTSRFSETSTALVYDETSCG